MFLVMVIVIIVFLSAGMIASLIEYFQYKRNPVILLQSYDKRFAEIKSSYLHTFNDIKRGD